MRGRHFTYFLIYPDMHVPDIHKSKIYNQKCFFIISIDSQRYISLTPEPRQLLEAFSPARMVLILLITFLILLDLNQVQPRPAFTLGTVPVVPAMTGLSRILRILTWSWSKRTQQWDQEGGQIKNEMIPYPRIG